MTMKRNSAAVAGIILAVLLGNALTGFAPVGYHADCIDGIDNDGDGMTDADDMECSEYPYSDGNGEETTPQESRSYDGTATGFESLPDYIVLGNDPMMVQDNLCIGLAFGYFNEPDLQDAMGYQVSMDFNCDSGGP